MKRRVLAAAALVVGAGCAGLLGHDEAGVPETLQEQFDVFWDAFDQYYPYFAFKGVDWDSVRASTESTAVATGDQFAFLLALRDAVRPLRDGHIWFEDASGWTIRGYSVPYRYLNYSEALLAPLAPAAGWSERPQLRYGRLADSVPYVAITAWGAGFRVADFDAALAGFRNDTMLILDVRQNDGGDDALAYQVAGRFTAAPVLAEYTQVRYGPRRADLTAYQARTLQPRGPWAFAGRVAVLAGRETLSASESFLSAMRELPTVAVIGDRTGGSTGSPRPVALGAGWKVWVPRVLYRTADSVVVEWNGIRPDFEVVWEVTTRDTVVAFARQWLRCGTCVTRPAP